MFVDQQLRNSSYGATVQIANRLPCICGFYITHNYTHKHKRTRTRTRGRIRLNVEPASHVHSCQQNKQQTQETNILAVSGIRTRNFNVFRPTP